ncbi:MAG: hypothetical protein AAF125_15300, partial [Chloroflexota bacterium]
MADPRQLPLFASQPKSEKDLNKTTPLQYALPLFAEYLKKDGKSANTVKAFIADMELLCEHAGPDVALSSMQTSHLNRYLEWME